MEDYSTIGESWSALASARAGRVRRVQQMEATGLATAMMVTGRVHRVVTQLLDRQQPGEGVWIPRPADQLRGREKNLRHLYDLLDREDGGILENFENGELLIWGKHSRQGQHARVSPDPSRKALFRSEGCGCQMEWCNHVDIARMKAGYTKLSDPNARHDVRAEPREQAPATKQAVLEADVPTEPPAREQVHRTRARRPEVSQAPRPLEPVIGKVEFEFQDVKVRLYEIPTAAYKGVVRDTKEVMGVHLEPQQSVHIGPENLAQTCRNLERGTWYSMDDILRLAEPAWEDLVPEAQKRLRDQFSQRIITKLFRDELGNDLKWDSRKDPGNKKKWQYRVVPT